MPVIKIHLISSPIPHSYLHSRGHGTTHWCIHQLIPCPSTHRHNSITNNITFSYNSSWLLQHTCADVINSSRRESMLASTRYTVTTGYSNWNTFQFHFPYAQYPGSRLLVIRERISDPGIKTLQIVMPSKKWPRIVMVLSSSYSLSQEGCFTEHHCDRCHSWQSLTLIRWSR